MSQPPAREALRRKSGILPDRLPGILPGIDIKTLRAIRECRDLPSSRTIPRRASGGAGQDAQPTNQEGCLSYERPGDASNETKLLFAFAVTSLRGFFAVS